MKKIHKLTAVLATLPFLFTSCVEEIGNGTEELEQNDCQNVYFQEMSNQEIELEPAQAKELTFKVYRQRKENPEELTAVTVPVELEASRLESGEKAFVLTDIVFEEGQLETSFKVKFPEAKLGVTYNCAIAITDPAYVSKFSKDPTRLNFNVTRIQWLPVKSEDGEENTGYFVDGLACEMLESSELPIKKYLKKPVTIERRSDKKGIYRIKNLYDEDFFSHMLNIPPESVSQIGVKCTPSSIIIDARDTTKVTWVRGEAGFDIQLGPVYFFSMTPENFPMIGPSDALYGTFKNGIIKFPPKSIGFETGPVFSIVNLSGKTRIIFPGYRDIDFDLSVSAGMSDQNGELPIKVTKGKDITKIKFAILQGALPPLGIVKAANKIGDGTLESTELESSAKKIVVSKEKSGVYTVVLAGFDKDDKYVANAGSPIYYVAKGEERKVIMNCGIIVSDKYASQGNTAENSLEIFISGKDLDDVHYGLYPKDLYDSMPEDVEKAVMMTPALPDKYLDEANATVWSGVINELQAGTEYILLVNASNKYTRKLEKYIAKTEGEFDPLQAVYFPASLKKEVSKEEYIGKKMYLYQYEDKPDKRVNLGEVKLTDGGQSESEGKTIELINVEGIWKAAAAADDPHFKIEKDVTTFVYLDGQLYNWKSSYGNVTAEVINPDTGETFIKTAPGALTSIFQYQDMGPIPLSYRGGVTREGNIAFMDSGEFAEDHGACLALGLGLYADNRLDELKAMISVLSNFILVNEDAVEEKVPAPMKHASYTVKTIMQRAAIKSTGSTYKPLLSNWHGIPIHTAGHLTDIRPEYEALPAEFNISVEF